MLGTERAAAAVGRRRARHPDALDPEVRTVQPEGY